MSNKEKQMSEADEALQQLAEHSPNWVKIIQAEIQRLRAELEKRDNVVLELIKRREQIDAVRSAIPCRSGGDGDCKWESCPQKKNYLSGCPLFDWDHDEDGIDLRPELVEPKP
jgi:hypothetical protein